MSAYCIKVSEHGDFLTSVFKQEQYMSIFLAAHVLLVSVLNPCFLLHAHFFVLLQKILIGRLHFIASVILGCCYLLSS